MKKLIIAIFILIGIGLAGIASAGTLHVNFTCTHPSYIEATDLFQQAVTCLAENNFVPTYEKGVTLQKYPKAVTDMCFTCSNYKYTKLNTPDGKMIVCRNLNVPNGCLVMNTTNNKIFWYCAKNAPRGGIFEITP